ncbi:sigma-54-dependent transcriptional regulator [Limobrevibacterium gyesilva]|uniref:DNA-binding transcriptional regulator NtrC n=1 Tax=Limobrevibacterium gyesilva TaxID=2991712 RepID=A0AA41YP84_9PROT|nr:sigma-54 dependent transcriptional regulator [Limobrevibacterium gyesilva]MCW3474143.1 sigma-54 dependent transcriptional regulator [Limobrevibacterium gyesilva]
MPVILIVDDDAALREGLAEAISDLGHTPLEAPDGAAALAAVAGRHVDAVLLDLRMPGMDGLEVLRRLHDRPEAPPVAVLTAVPTASNTIEAMRLGAVDHIAKPIGRDDLAALIARMLPAAPAAAAVAPAGEADDLIGNSAAMRQVQKQIGMLADAGTTVLITGETGTGKEVVARALHRHGRRAGRPFVAVNCAAIPADLLESQLFGHARGAFTGAVADRTGSFREADGGTLFLDEIGDMAPPLQAKLLRVLQDRVVTPVGGKPVPVDVRILAATHQDLEARVREGRFREDLFWRLGVVPIHLPPLRERLADILPLAEHFLALAAGSAAPKQLSADAAARLLSHPWPGNVRELRNAMERAAALARRPVITGTDLAFLRMPGGGAEVDWLEGDLPTALARLEAAMIRRALDAAGGNRAEAARRLNIHRQLLYEKMRRHGLDMSANRTGSVGNADDPAPLDGS